MRVTLIHNPKAGANEQPSVDEILGYEDEDMHIDDKVWPAHGSTAAHVPTHLEMKVDSQILEFLV
jgi:hypothetical protein